MLRYETGFAIGATGFVVCAMRYLGEITSETGRTGYRISRAVLPEVYATMTEAQAVTNRYNSDLDIVKNIFTNTLKEGILQ